MGRGIGSGIGCCGRGGGGRRGGSWGGGAGRGGGGEEVVARMVAEWKAARAEALLVTEKDWSKLMGVELPCPVARVRLEMKFERGGEELERVVVGGVEGFEVEG